MCDIAFGSKGSRVNATKHVRGRSIADTSTRQVELSGPGILNNNQVLTSTKNHYRATYTTVVPCIAWYVSLYIVHSRGK